MLLPGGLEITAAPAYHFSGRSVLNRNASMWSSFVIRDERQSVLFSGDTGLSAAFGEIGERLGTFYLVLMEVGGFHPSWGDVHLGPRNALQALSELGSGRMLPIHWGTFDLASHPWHDPAEALLQMAPGGKLIMPRLGEPLEPAHITEVTPWWRSLVHRR